MKLELESWELERILLGLKTVKHHYENILPYYGNTKDDAKELKLCIDLIAKIEKYIRQP